MLTALAMLLGAQAPGGPPLPPDGYRSPEAVAAAVEALAAEATAVIDLATTPGGRPVRILRYGHDAPGRPAILIVANCEGDRLVATEVALGLCQHLAQGSALLEAADVYVLPLANPDGAAAAYAGQSPWRGAPVDEDRDGRSDEDGPDDLDGDGHALWMRVPEIGGPYLVDPTDARSSREADAEAGESGTFRLMREGADEDGDRVAQEDGPGGVRWDRNWPHRHRLHARDSGDFQLSEAETRGLAEFLVGRRDLALVVVLDDEDNLVKAPGGKDRVDKNSTEPLEEDAALLKLLGERLDYEELPPPRGAEHGHGNFADWMYHQRGVLVLESALWSIPLDADPSSEGDDVVTPPEDAEEDEDGPEWDTDELKMLLWIDLNYGGGGFALWQTVEHPRYGEVEVGGWLPLVRENPPARELPALVTQWADFLDRLAADLPRVEWTEVEIEDLGSGVHDVRATLVNPRLMPTCAAIGTSTRQALPLRVWLELPEGAELLSGDVVDSVERLDGLGGKRSFRWLYRLPEGSEPASLRATSRTAGEAVHVLENEA